MHAVLMYHVKITEAIKCNFQRVLQFYRIISVANATDIKTTMWSDWCYSGTLII